MTRTCTFFFSFRSPYSWLASRLLEDMLERPGALELVPFWEPDAESARLLHQRGGNFPYQSMSDAKHRYILQDVRRLVQSHGLSITWPVDTDPWWDLSHLAYLKAESLGAGLPYLKAVYRARWERGEDIGERQVIEAVGKEIGLDGRALAAVPEDPEMRALGADSLYRIYRDDVFGVPYFFHKRERFWGVDRLPQFVQRLQIGSKSATSTKSRIGSEKATDAIYEFDHAGGCG